MALTELEKEEIKKELIEEQKAARRAYKREWNRKHPEKVKEYLNGRLSSKIRDQINESEEKFYEKVKKILLEEGEIPNAIGRLTNKSEFELLSYDERQRYTLSLSERYVKAVERFNYEKSLGIID